MEATGVYRTQHASKYLQQLCKHFAHKVQVEYDRHQGNVIFPMGTATMNADDERLSITISATDDKGIQMAKNIVDSHLVRFAHREDFSQMDWQAA